jgi:hypothetical protein
MGATGWKASILRAGRDVSRQHKTALKRAGTKGFRAPEDLQPWSFDNRLLAFITWESPNPVHVYGVETGEDIEIQTETAFPYSVQFAHDVDRLLISFPGWGKLYDQRGALRSIVPWRVADGEVPFVFWAAGGQFLWLGRESRSSPTLVRVYSGLDGARLGSQPLDPQEILPYDHDAYKRISRTGCPLRIGPRTYSAGELLDRWNDVRFDHSSKRLLMSVFRPVSPPYQHGHQLICDVEERWIAARVVSA